MHTGIAGFNLPFLHRVGFIDNKSDGTPWIWGLFPIGGPLSSSALLPYSLCSYYNYVVTAVCADIKKKQSVTCM